MVQRKSVRDASEWDLIEEGAGEMFHRFCHAWSARVSPENPLPATAEEWPAIRDARRARLREAMGLTLADPCPLRPEVVAVEDRGDYTLERVLLHSRPNLVMTTHLYVPKEAPKPAPAILSVHGHWSQGKLAPRVQERNIGMAKLGFVVLCVDAIGSGERAYPGEEYHGRQLGAQALPAGLTLPGLQVWDNMRALDYCNRGAREWFARHQLDLPGLRIAPGRGPLRHLQDLLDRGLRVLRRLVGQRLRLLVEGPSKTNPEVFSGRSFHAKLVHFTGGDESLTGKYAWVEITGADVYTLTGKFVGV